MPLSRFQPERYAELLAQKQTRLQASLAEHGITDFETHASAPMHYRMRAEFRIWHVGETCHYAMFRPEDPATPVFIDDFPVACSAIHDRLPALLQHLNSHAQLRRGLYQVEWLATTTGQCLLSLIYRRPLAEGWEDAARALETALGVFVIGRSRGVKRVITQDWIDECLNIQGRDWHWRQPEGAFTQPNAGTNRAMLDWALRQAPDQGRQGDLLELYCGIGNFTLPLSTRFRRVLATEVNKTACRTAEHNLQQNGVSNTHLVRLSGEETASALKRERPFRRLAHLNLDDYDFRCLLVDPPRAGLDEHTRQFAASFEHILYISCQPDTLFRDVDALKSTHRITQAALFDQFPYTDHRECGLLLARR